MHSFVDGAFKMAIQQQVPVVPVTLLTNYKILPDETPIRLSRYPMKAIVHEPLVTVGLGQEDVMTLKNNCFEVIDRALRGVHKL